MSGKYVIYFDSGTTNSRVYLLDEAYQICFTAKRPVGSRDSAIEGSNLVLIRALKELYDEVFEKTGITEDAVEGIYASGMITSPYGLREIPHIVLPQTLEEFSKHVYCHHEDKIFHRDIWLIPGIKTIGDDISFTNNTRGEEIEVLGAIDDLHKKGADEKIALILPGSHTHVVYVEGDTLVGIISNFTGEAFHALQKDTILAPVLSVEDPELVPEMVSKGTQDLLKFGFSRAIYIAHAMRIFYTGSESDRFSYAEGVISGGVRESLEYYCRNIWPECRQAAVVGDVFMYRVFSAIFEGSPYIEKIHWLPIESGKSYAVKGAQKILTYRKEHNL